MPCKCDDCDKICSTGIFHCGLNDRDRDITNSSVERHYKFRSEIFVLIPTCNLSDSRLLWHPKQKRV